MNFKEGTRQNFHLLIFVTESFVFCCYHSTDKLNQDLIKSQQIESRSVNLWTRNAEAEMFLQKKVICYFM